MAINKKYRLKYFCKVPFKIIIYLKEIKIHLLPILDYLLIYFMVVTFY